MPVIVSSRQQNPGVKTSESRSWSLTGGQKFRVWDEAPPQTQAKVHNRRPSVGRRCGLGGSNGSGQKRAR